MTCYIQYVNTVLFPLDVDVKEMFPEFRQNSVLRFSRLFPIKPSHRPRIWKNVKKRTAKKESQKVVEEEEEEVTATQTRWKLNYAELPENPDAFEEDDVVRFHKPKEQKMEKEETDERDAERKGPKPTDWRWGPAQYW